ncbi:hypothetical protein S83_047373, partial [Arachis hypogaea]
IARSQDKLLLLVTFAQMLLSAPTNKNDNMEPVYHLPVEQKADDDSWGLVIEALLAGSGTSSGGGLPFIGLHSLEDGKLHEHKIITCSRIDSHFINYQ